MKVTRLFILVVLVSLAFSAIAQLSFSPQIGISRREDVLAKQAQNILFFGLENRDGEVVAVRSVDENPQPVLLPQGYGIRLDVAVANLVVDRVRYSTFPDSFEGLKVKKERERSVAQLGWGELNKLDLGNKQALYQGRLKLDGARVGPNTLFLRIETRHANHTNLLMLSFSDWRRNYLNDGIPIRIVRAPAEGGQGELLLQLKANGWYFVDPKVDDQLTALLKQQAQPQIVQSQQAQGETVRNDSGLIEDRQVDERKLGAPKVSFFVGGSAVGPNFEMSNGQSLLIRHPGEFEVTVKRYAEGGEVVVYQKKVSDGVNLTSTNLKPGLRYIVTVRAGGQIRAVNTFTVSGKEVGR